MYIRYTYIFYWIPVRLWFGLDHPAQKIAASDVMNNLFYNNLLLFILLIVN